MSAATTGSWLPYEIAEEFHWLSCAEESYEASIATMDASVIKLTLDDFVQCYTQAQAAQVTRCLFEAIGVAQTVRPCLCSSGEDALRKNSYENAFDHFVQDPRPQNETFPDRPNVMTPLNRPGYLYIAGGKYSDPQPHNEFTEDDEAIYEMVVACETGDSFEMRFGMFSMRFNAEQALWLWFHMSLAANSLGQHRWVGTNSKRVD
ncbi:hypothetical protein [Pseudomonas fluorescens]|uniref:Uncharacterized protein n=1 Tax=Pseudomonas fluorescens TaxID=294 RepID=A0A5E7J049_PSEFL|nr:hypothetical protein [Pseudomonas fluorescens]VVO76713.1 hypothetical protein PS854_01584 [Pseudomonas fluorescens]